MSDVTRLIQAIGDGDSRATAELLPIVYDELRRLARLRMANERAGHTLEATALVHEAYLRLVGDADPNWSGRGHFFAAAAEAMRRILVENARRKASLKHGGEFNRVELNSACAAAAPPSIDLLALDESLANLAKLDPAKAELVKLRYFAGMTMPEAAAALGIALSTAERYWTFARSWLYAELSEGSSGVEE
jgi:RNA polymerase sigma factor (TIGR02999 family)